MGKIGGFFSPILCFYNSQNHYTKQAKTRLKIKDKTSVEMTLKKTETWPKISAKKRGEIQHKNHLGITLNLRMKFVLFRRYNSVSKGVDFGSKGVKTCLKKSKIFGKKFEKAF